METKVNIIKAVLAVMAEVKNIDKNTKVGTGSTSYDGVSDKDVKLIIGAAMEKNGLIAVPIEIEPVVKVDRWEETNQYGTKAKQVVFTEVKTKYLLMHTSGESMEIAGYGHGADAQDKGAGKATTYALKNALLYTFMVPTGKIDDTDNTHSDDHATPPAKQQPAQPAAKPNLQPGTDTWNAAVIELSKFDGLVFDFFDKVRKKYALTEANQKLMTAESEKVRASQVTEPTEAEKVAALNKQDSPAPAEITQEIRVAVAACTDMKSLTDLYNTNTALHANKEFTDMFTSRKMAIAIPKGNAKRATAAA